MISASNNLYSPTVHIGNLGREEKKRKRWERVRERERKKERDREKRRVGGIDREREVHESI